MVRESEPHRKQATLPPCKRRYPVIAGGSLSTRRAKRATMRADARNVEKRFLMTWLLSIAAGTSRNNCF